MSTGGIGLLRRLEFFSVFDEDALKLIAFATDEQEVAAGGVVFKQGSPAPGGVVILSGTVRLSGSGDHATVLTAGPGDLIGELALLIPTERALTAIAETECRFMTVSRTVVKRALVQFPETAMRLQTMLSGRLRELNAGLTAVSGMLEKIDTPL